MICIAGGSKNPLRSKVASSIVDAIHKASATGTTPAIYWSKEEQEQRLQEMYNKWDAVGTVWSAAAPKVSRLSLIYWPTRIMIA